MGITRIFLLTILLINGMPSHPLASDIFDTDRPAKVGNEKWSRLEQAVQTTKLLPQPPGARWQRN